MTNEEITRKDLMKQAEAVKGAVAASTYYPVAHGEAERLKQMIEEYEGD